MRKGVFAIYTFYFYSTKSKLTVITQPTSEFQALYSIDRVYGGANWAERELSEMYGVLFYNKTDTRKLLLDYSKTENPMLKDFPSEGFSDVYYSLLENQVVYYQNEVVEL